MKNSFYSWIILAVLVGVSIMIVSPPKEKINLGIDLKGGYSFTLEVQTPDEATDKERKEAQERALEVIRNRVDASGGKEPIIYPVPGSSRIVVQLPGQSMKDRDTILRILKQPAKLAFRMVHNENDQLINQLGVTKKAPKGFEFVEAPTQRQPNRFFYRKLEVLDDQAIDFENKANREALKRFERPSQSSEFLLEKTDYNGQVLYQPYFVERREQMTGEFLDNAMVQYGQFNEPQIGLKFKGKGKDQFAKVTSDYSPGGAKNPDQNNFRQMAIILDDSVYSAPNLNEPIYGGSAQITGQFSAMEAQTLAMIMNAGALPDPIEVLEERSVAPTLGRDAVNSGINAAKWGILAIVVFMLFYYMLAGLVVNLALLLDAILLPLGMICAAGFLGVFSNSSGMVSANELPTLTLPGIAGLILTIGMAVDANVLIFERIREEQNAGKRFATAISSGYEKVFSTIFDANITTLIVAVILFWQGSGPIRGFAVTLSAGIIVSMYTALVVTRMLFDLLAKNKNIKTIKMHSLVSNTKINFIGMRIPAAILSVAVIGSTMFFFVQKGKDNFGVDFTGGRALTYAVNAEAVPKQADIEAKLAEVGVSEVYVQFQKELDTGKEFVEIKVAHEIGDKSKAALEPMMNPGGEQLLQDDTVGPQVGSELKKKGIWAIISALIGIVIYISFRFEFAFAMGAIAALAHDVLITVGIYCLFDRQLSLPIVAALLTIVGYSVNDTIVVFDRIREDLRLIKHKPYKEIANMSINRTLSRTLLTSITTLLTVVMLLVFGGGAINDFALALFIGIIVGTYSSTFVATPIMLLWHKEKVHTELVAEPAT